MTQLYFAYGSNMKCSRLEERTGVATDLGMATLKDYRIAFNKQSKDGTGKTNIVSTERQDVLGVLYELSEKQLKELDHSEKGYARVSLQVDLNGNAVDVQTYIALPESINEDLLPTTEYMRYLIDGAVEHGFPGEYKAFLKSFKVRK